MLAKNSYLVMAAMFFGFAISAHFDNDSFAAAILIWFGVVFVVDFLIIEDSKWTILTAAGINKEE